MTSTHESPTTPERRRKDRRTQTAGEGLLLDIAALAAHLDVTERFVRRLVEERRVPFHKIGKFVRFHPADIDAWIKKQRVDQVNGT